MIEERNRERPATIEVWTNGSLNTIPSRIVDEIQHHERVSVQWHEGVFRGAIYLYSEDQEHNATHNTAFQNKHHTKPHFRLKYDDRDENLYRITSPLQPSQVQILHQDG